VAPPIPERNFDDEDDGELENVEADGQGQEEGEPPAEAPGEEASPEAVQVMWFGESTPFDLTLFSVLFCYSGLHYLQNVTETRWLFSCLVGERSFMQVAPAVHPILCCDGFPAGTCMLGRPGFEKWCVSVFW